MTQRPVHENPVTGEYVVQLTDPREQREEALVAHLFVSPGATVPPGTVHDWWQVGEETAEVIVEVLPGIRFAEMVASMFGLARDGKVSPEGMPDPLQLAVMGAEYGDVIVFTSPPRIVQRLTIPPLALIGRMRGRKPMYEGYVESEVTAETDPEALAHLTEDGRLRPFDDA